MFGATDDAPRMNTLKGLSLKFVTCVIMFLTFFPRTFLEDIILVQTNKQLDHEMTFGEFLWWIGVWFIISKNLPGNLNRREFWSAKAPSRECGAPFRPNNIMSGRQFEEICQAILYKDQEEPQFKDCFWEVWQMIKVWNKNMVKSSH